MINEIYNLPEISIFGGSTFAKTFDVKKADGTNYNNLDELVINFSVCNYTNRDNSSALLQFTSSDQTPKVTAVSSGTGDQIFVEMDASDTLALSGKYVYQIMVKDETAGTYDVCGQGILHISKNINPGFVS